MAEIELEQLRKRVEYLDRVRATAWRQLGEKDAEISRLRDGIREHRRKLALFIDLAVQASEIKQLRREVEKARPGDLLATIHRLPKGV